MAIPPGFRFHHQGGYYMTENGEGPFFITANGEVHQGLEPRYMTDENGPYARLRVDVAQTSFFAGREFMAFHEYSIAAGASIAIRAISLVDIFLQKFSVDNWTGDVRIELRMGGTVVTPFNIDIPVYRTNQTAAAPTSYVSQVDLDNGGSITGGTLLDVHQVSSGNKATAVSASSDDPIGFAAGTYYISVTNTGSHTATGVFKARWEERP